MTEASWNHRLKALRKGVHMRQEDVAKQIGVARTTYLNMESGARLPREYELQKLSELYKIPVDDILYGEIDDSETRTRRSWQCVSTEEYGLLKLIRKGDFRGAVEHMLQIMSEK